MRTILRWTPLVLILACQAPPPEAEPEAAPPVPELGSAEWRIWAFSTAAPAEIAAGATVLDWDADAGAPGGVLREGSNGWTCLPLAGPPEGGYTEPVQAMPMCADAMTMAWAQARGSNTTPELSTIGIGYMLHGDQGASNIDPQADSQTADNDWVVEGPHVMIFPADLASLEGMSTDHRSGAPYVMWAGTPYAHVMMPVE